MRRLAGRAVVPELKTIRARWTLLSDVSRGIVLVAVRAVAVRPQGRDLGQTVQRIVRELLVQLAERVVARPQIARGVVAVPDVLDRLRLDLVAQGRRTREAMVS
jgi:hypothetical protein